MASLHDLQWEIQQELHQLIKTANREVLYKLAVTCKDEVEEDLPDDIATAVELFDFIVDFLRNKQLQSLEDQDMSRLLLFCDLIDELQLNERAKGPGEAPEEATTGKVPGTESVVAASEMITVLTSVAADQVTRLVKLKDVAALLPSREFRVYGEQISASDSNFSFNNLCKQIDEGLTDSFTDAEIF